MHGSALYNGAPVERRVDGFADPLIRVSAIIHHGAPALSPAAFREYRQNFLVATSLQVSVPVGQYDASRIRHRRQPLVGEAQIGVSKRRGRWIFEGATAATFYGTNAHFFGGAKRSQARSYSVRAHLIYALPSGPWAALDATYFEGGRTRVNGAADCNLQSNTRVGLTVAAPIGHGFSVKANASRGVSARTGNNYDLFGLALQYRWLK